MEVLFNLLPILFYKNQMVGCSVDTVSNICFSWFFPINLAWV